MIGHKTSLNKFKNIKIISSISSCDNAIRLEFNKEKTVKKKNTHMEAKQHATKQPMDQ